MPILHSGKKQMRKSVTNRSFNETRKRSMKEVLKGLKKDIIAKEVAPATLSKAYQTIDKAAKRGVIKKNTANRMKSRITKNVANAK